MNKAEIETLAKSPYAPMFMQFIKDESARLQSIKGIQSEKELFGRQEAIKILEEMFRKLDMAKKPTEDNQKNEYQ